MTETRSQPNVSVPTSISAAAQQYLTTPQPFGDVTAPEDPTDTEAWLRYIEPFGLVARRRSVPSSRTVRIRC